MTLQEGLDRPKQSDDETLETLPPGHSRDDSVKYHQVQYIPFLEHHLCCAPRKVNSLSLWINVQERSFPPLKIMALAVYSIFVFGISTCNISAGPNFAVLEQRNRWPSDTLPKYFLSNPGPDKPKRLESKVFPFVARCHIDSREACFPGASLKDCITTSLSARLFWQQTASVSPRLSQPHLWPFRHPFLPSLRNFGFDPAMIGFLEVVQV